jgi:hypothetical protein
MGTDKHGFDANFKMNEFADYCFCSTWDGDGEIHNQEGKIVWRFQTTGLKQRLIKSGIGQSPVFAFLDATGQELATIYRERRLPLARFVVVKNDLRLCMIWQRSIWFTKYEFEFDNKSKWKLCLPMFSVSGKAISESGAEILVRARTRRQWFARISAGLDSPSMMAALAFVIRKKLQCT